MVATNKELMIPSVSLLTYDLFSTKFSDARSHEVFNEIDRLCVAEMLFKLSLVAHMKFILSNDYKITTESQRELDWLTKRFMEIEAGSGVPFWDLLATGVCLFLKYSNVFYWLKRGPVPGASKVRSTTGKILQPIQSMRCLPPNYVTPEIDDKTMKVTNWILWYGTKHQVTVPLEDMIFIREIETDRTIFTPPWFLTVMDQINILRKSEELSMASVENILSPPVHMQIGTKDRPMEVDPETGLSEVEVYTDLVDQLSIFGWMVTSDRVKINPIDVGTDANQVVTVLEYFLKRNREGLGISVLDTGGGEGAGRDASIALNEYGVQRAELFAAQLIKRLSFYLIRPLLVEGRISPTLTTGISFGEINPVRQGNVERRVTGLWQNNQITFPEMRRKIGMPVVPEGTDKEFIHSKFPGQSAAEQAHHRQSSSVIAPVNQKGPVDKPRTPKR